jgi:hypothetical protein
MGDRFHRFRIRIFFCRLSPWFAQQFSASFAVVSYRGNFKMRGKWKIYIQLVDGAVNESDRSFAHPLSSHAIGPLGQYSGGKFSLS